MNSKTSLATVLITLLIFALACGQGTNQPQIDQQSIETSVAATEAVIAAQTAAAVPPPTATTAAPTPTIDPNTIFAPDPLTVAYTGLIFDFGTCYDWDTYQPAPAADASVDICLDANGVLNPQNGALISGHAPMTAPSKGYCINPSLLPDQVAVQTDLFLCLQTNQSTYGFFVARDFQYEQNRVIFDMYLFP